MLWWTGFKQPINFIPLKKFVQISFLLLSNFFNNRIMKKFHESKFMPFMYDKYNSPENYLQAIRKVSVYLFNQIQHALSVCNLGARPMAKWLSLNTDLVGLLFASSDPGPGPTHRSWSHAVAASHTQNRGGLTHMLAQGISSSSKRKKISTHVNSGPIFLTKLHGFYLKSISVHRNTVITQIKVTKILYWTHWDSVLETSNYIFHPFNQILADITMCQAQCWILWNILNDFTGRMFFFLITLCLMQY